MVRIMIATSFMFFSVVMGRIAFADDPVPPVTICGWAVYGLCPGCAPSSPTDGTCSCGVNQMGCDCIKQTGGVQTGLIVVCNGGNFTYHADPDGYRVVVDMELPCKEERRCRWQESDGSELNCGVLNGGSCVEVQQCSWTTTSLSMRRTYKSTLLCEPL